MRHKQSRPLHCKPNGKDGSRQDHQGRKPSGTQQARVLGGEPEGDE